MNRIRVENLPTVYPRSYAASVVEFGAGDLERVRPFTVLFIKPFADRRGYTYGPPLGILMLAAGIREFFGSRARVYFLDMSVYNLEPDRLADYLDDYSPDVVAVSALNYDAAASYRIAEVVQAWNDDTVTVIGGPLTLHQAEMIFEESSYDWVFEGPADRTFLIALQRFFADFELGNDLAGFSYRSRNGSVVLDPGQDLFQDLDSIPLPAWDLVDFDRYRRRDRNRMIANVKERKYAFLFTSRGCPYKCNYCHDVFTKRFIYRSEEHVLNEMRLLYHDYGIREFHIIDDIFNLHRPRVQSLMKKIRDEFKGEIFIAFPNGLRGDIFDQATIDAMVAAGTYHAGISVETVTPHLQELVEKYLDVEKAEWAINEFSRQGVTVQGAFMVGFPTESVEEIEKTIQFAVRSRLLHAYFFAVLPQPQTPIFELARKESVEASRVIAEEEKGMHFRSPRPWYYLAYGYDLEKKISLAYFRFYMHPPRFMRLVLRTSPYVIVRAGLFMLGRLMGSLSRGLWRSWGTWVPEKKRLS